MSARNALSVCSSYQLTPLTPVTVFYSRCESVSTVRSVSAVCSALSRLPLHLRLALLSLACQSSHHFIFVSPCCTEAKVSFLNCKHQQRRVHLKWKADSWVLLVHALSRSLPRERARVRTQLLCDRPGPAQLCESPPDVLVIVLS